MTVNKGLSALANSNPNFSNQGLENAVNELKIGWVIKSSTLDTKIADNTVLTTSQKNDLKDLINNVPHLNVGRVLGDLIRHTKTTTILVTHDIKYALNISDRILVFKAGIIQQYAEPIKIYCEPANCYCAKILGDINQITFDQEVKFIRPENLRVVNNSNYSVLVEKSYFQGNIYKIKGTLENLPCHFFSTATK